MGNSEEMSVTWQDSHCEEEKRGNIGLHTCKMYCTVYTVQYIAYTIQLTGYHFSSWFILSVTAAWQPLLFLYLSPAI